MSKLSFIKYPQDLELAIIFALVVFVVTALAFVLLQPRRRRFRPTAQIIGLKQYSKRDLADVGQQLHAVMAGSFEKRRVLNATEYRVLSIVENEIALQQAGYRVFAQTSLGEILSSKNDDAFHSINSKRVDILVVDRGGWPYLAIECQGEGHYKGTAAARDAVKKEALRKAGVKYIEINAADTDAQIRNRVREQFTTAKMMAQTRT